MRAYRLNVKLSILSSVTRNGHNDVDDDICINYMHYAEQTQLAQPHNFISG